MNTVIRKMKNCIILVILFLASSCAYYPHLTDVPLIRKKGDTRLEGGITLLAPTAHASVSYGLTENIAIQAAGIVGTDDHYYVQGAAGLFKNIQDRKVMELYAGFGYGYSYVYKDANPGSLSGNHQVYFAQFNRGTIKGNKEYGISLKSGYLHSKMTDRSYFDVYYLENKPIPVLNMNNIIIEPTIFTRFGWEKLKFQLGVSICWVFQLNHTDKKYPFSPINLGLGISYSL